MKSFARWKSILALALIGTMLLPVCACGKTSETEDTTQAGTVEGTTAGTESETEEEQKPFVPKANYNSEFTAIYCHDTFLNGYFFANPETAEDAGNDLEYSLFERTEKIKDYLGVTVVPYDGGNFLEYGPKVSKAVSSGDDAYQLVMTHVSAQVAPFITQNFFRDFKDFENINLDGDYWNRELMDKLAINDQLFCGYNDFCLAYCYLIAFNKEMAKTNADKIGNLYEAVRNKEWTLEKMMADASLVGQENGDGIWDTDDTYGFTGWGWVPLCSFQVGCDIPTIRTQSDGRLYVSPMKDNQDRILDLVSRMYDFYKQDYTLMWDLNAPADKQLHLSSGRVLYQMMSNYGLTDYRGSEVKVGVLPYPLYDSNQESYRTMNWNGLLGIPTTIRSEKMVGDVIEMLAYFSGPVKVAFYENLLGAKLMDAPEDAEMMNIVWDNQISDVGLHFSDSSSQLNNLVYAIPQLLTVYHRGEYTSFYRKNAKAAEGKLNKMFE